MTRKEAQEWKSRREIPDPQVRDAADQYEVARQLLERQPPGSGVLWPLMNTAAVAIELYLKCLSAETVHISCDDGLGQLVHSEPTIRDHSLLNLFDEIPADVRRDINRAYKDTDSASSRDLRSDLSLLDGAFMTTRYPFEAQVDASGIDLKLLMSLSSFLRQFSATLKPKETIQWE